MKIANRLADRFARIMPLPEGTYHKQAAPADQAPYRLHLRLRGDGSGILIVNAATVLHLNPSAAEYAYHFIRGTDLQEAAKEIAARYRVSKGLALEDYRDFTERIEMLVGSTDVDPVSYLGFERLLPYSTPLGAPVRLDCALTYQLPPGSRTDSAPVKRVVRELETTEWQTILDKAWQAGVPHITFTGGEPTMRPDLVALIAHSEKNGQVCGLLTDGVKLVDPGYLSALLQTGLDHVLLIFQPDLPQAWKAVDVLVAADIFLTVHLTLTDARRADAEGVLTRLADAGVRNVSLSAANSALAGQLASLRQQASDLGLTLRWDLPVPYSAANPVAHETETDRIPSGAGNAWLYVEPDGDVLQAQGASEQVLGNLLRDDWKSIHP